MSMLKFNLKRVIDYILYALNFRSSEAKEFIIIIIFLAKETSYKFYTKDIYHLFFYHFGKNNKNIVGYY